MPREGRSRAVSVLCLSILLLALSPTARAHDKKHVGAVHLTIGWGDEPVFTGLRNSVDVDVADAAGIPIADIAGTLNVEVAFGGERATLPLLPGGQKGRFHAWIVPTRVGQYTFRVTGTVRGQVIDVTSACSDATFHCVADIGGIQFPAKDPSPGDLAERLGRELPRAERAVQTATTARHVGLSAIALAALALAAAIVAGMRRTSRGT
jgi:hypothetical protein